MSDPGSSEHYTSRRTKLVRAALLAFAVLSFLVVASAVWVWRTLYTDRVDPSTATVHFMVAEGASLQRVALDLQSAGLWDRPWALRAVARLDGRERAVRAGEHELPLGASPHRLFRLLVEGPLVTRAVTLPEGWSARRTVRALADSLAIAEAELQQLVDEPPDAWRSRLSIPEGHGLEGYLFPQTYRFTRGLDARRVLETLVSTLEAALDDTLRARIEAHPFDLHQVLTLASIVEAEATRDDERSRVAAVYLNRMAKGWKLEADPTVAYAVDKVGERLLLSDLRVESPYNTYRNTGLPPGPINNPGLASIRAVLDPEPDFDAMYFVADGAGGHRFSRTWEEHRRAVELYRRWQREQRARDGSG